jgi:hypothetical protein
MINSNSGSNQHNIEINDNQPRYQKVFAGQSLVKMMYLLLLAETVIEAFPIKD